jgi:hypothetical protein
MNVLEKGPLTLSVPLREEPAGVLRAAYLRGTSPQEIVQMYDSLALGDVYAVLAYYLAHPDEIDEYLRKSGEEAEAIRRKIEASQISGPTKHDLLARAKAKGLVIPLLADQNFNGHILDEYPQQALPLTAASYSDCC